MLEQNFDELSRRAFADGATITDDENLWRSAFALPDWNFIARGKFPNVSPYIASNKDVAEGKYMIRAFTDTERLYRFAAENGLLDDDRASLILAIPTDGITEYLDQFISSGVHGIWFNSDSASTGFFSPLSQLRPIKTHLANLSS